MAAYRARPPKLPIYARWPCLKHRHGEPSDVALQFERRYQRFTPLDPEPAERGKATLAQLAALWGRTTPADDDDGDTA